MSVVFTVPTSAAPPIELALRGVHREGLVSSPELEGVWAEGVTRLHLPGRSTRGVEVALDPEELTVRMLSLASEDDWALGGQILGNIAAWAGVAIESDHHGTVPASELGQIIDGAWLELAKSGVGTVSALIASGRGPITIPGAVRDVCLGARTVADWGRDRDDATAARWLEEIRRIQYLERSLPGAVFGGKFTLTTKDDEERSLAIWTPAPHWGMPDVELVCIGGLTEEEKPLLIPQQAVETIAEGHWGWLDERQRLISTFDESRWPELRDRASAHAVLV